MTTVVTSALLFTAIVYVLLGLLIWERATRGDASWFLAWMMFSMAGWSAGYAGELHAQTLFGKMILLKAQYPFIAAVPVLWLFFVLEYTGHSTLLARWTRVALGLVPVVVVLANWTNEFHRLFYAEAYLQLDGDLILLAFTRSYLSWVNIIFSYLLLALGCSLLLFHVFQSTSTYRSQAVLFLIGTISPWAGSVVYVTGLSPLPWLDPTPFSFIPTGLILSWVIARYGFLEVTPPTQNDVMQSLRDGVLLLNGRSQVVYVNHIAEEILAIQAERSMGQPAEKVLSACAAPILSRLGETEQKVEIPLGVNGDAKHFEVLILPRAMGSSKRHTGKTGYTILFHDITDQKRAQEELKHHDTILRAVGLASELFLKSVSWRMNIPRVLERLGYAAGVSRVYIFEREMAGDVSLVSQRYEWVREGVEPQIDNPDLQKLEWIAAGYERWEETLSKRVTISGTVGEFPESERALLEAQGIFSVAVMPIFAEGKFWGFMGFDDCESERNWSQAELEALQAAADIFGAALTRGNIERRLYDRQLTLNLLHRILGAALRSPDFSSMTQGLVDDLVLLLDADSCFISLWDADSCRMTPVAVSGPDFVRETYYAKKLLPGEKTLTEAALEAGRTLMVEDIPHSPYASMRLNELHAISALVVPLIVENEGLGSVIFAFSQPHQFQQEEVDLAEEASNLVALALAKFQAVDAAHRRAEEADTLRRVGVTISETLNLQEATTHLLEQLAFVIPHDSASVQLLRGGELEIIGGEGWDNPSSVIGVRFPVPGDNPNTIVIQTRKPYRISDTFVEFPLFGTISHAAHIRSWLGVPLIVHNEIIGLLAIDSCEPNHFTADNMELAAAFAGQVAVAIENARLFEEVQRIAITDGLTGLYNRRHFMKLAEVEVQRALRYKSELSAIIFDIDHFKKINDEYGHPIGDQVLRAVAKLCTEKLREVDSIGRYGGEEFVALIVEAPLEAAQQVGDRLRRDVENMVVPTEKGEIHVTISVGIAGMNEFTPNLDTLINRADQALYSAKHHGRNRVVVGH